MTHDPIPRGHTLIWDLDGTISDPLVGIAASINHALQRNGLAGVDTERVRPLIGPPLTSIFRHLTGSQDADEITGLIDAYRERYARVGYTENTIYPDIPDLITSIADAYTLGVCTSKRSDYAAAILKMFGLQTCFAFLSGGDDGVEKRTQVAALIENGLNADQAVMIGDRRFDIEAAKAHSVFTIGVTWGFAAEGELESAGADVIVSSPAELSRLFV